MSFNNPSVPYNDLPFLPTDDFLDLGSLSKELIGARVALAKLDQASKLSRYTAALVSAIPLVEAQASSAIENIVTTQDDLFSAALDKAFSGDKALGAVLRYHSAMEVGAQYLEHRPINPELSRLICSTILGVDESFRQFPGTKIATNQDSEPIYTPPFGNEVISKLMENWAVFINTSTLDPLVKMAISHYQFEAIHPFRDGNGRTGRVINLLQLKADGLLSFPVLHLSRVIKDDLPNYYRLLRLATEDRSYQPWVSYMLEKVREASEIALFQLDMLSHYSTELATRGDLAFKGGIPASLLTAVTNFPYCTINEVMKRCEVSRPTATKWLEILVAEGLLEPLVRGRNKYFVNNKVLRILNP